jgi:hypothetical protein
MSHRAEKIKRVLILSPQSDQAMAVARYLRKYLRECELHGGILNGENAKESKYYDRLLLMGSAVALDEYDIVLPTGAKSTQWMATRFNRFQVGDLSYAKENLQYFDKFTLLARIEDFGIPIPRTFNDIEAIDTPYPVFYKQKYEKGGGGRGIAHTRADLKKRPDLQELIVQEYIPGRTTYGNGFIVKDSKIITSFQHEEFLSQPIQGGSAVLIKRFHDERLEEYTRRIIQYLGFEGWGLAEFKYCPKRRDFVFMEINAKLWASIEFAFMNNNQFLKYMFDIDYYPEKTVNAAIFVDRLVTLGWPQILRNIPHMFDSTIIRYRDTSQLLRELIVTGIPPKMRRYLKQAIFRSTT